MNGDTNGVIDVFVRDRKMGTTQRVSVSSQGGQANDLSTTPSISTTGRYIAFSLGRFQPGETRHERAAATCSSTTA